MTLLERTDHATYWPHKDDHAYRGIARGVERPTSAVWSYYATCVALAAAVRLFCLLSRMCRRDRGTSRFLSVSIFQVRFCRRNLVAMKDRKRMHSFRTVRNRTAAKGRRRHNRSSSQQLRLGADSGPSAIAMQWQECAQIAVIPRWLRGPVKSTPQRQFL
jgi:hypothetical protein